MECSNYGLSQTSWENFPVSSETEYSAPNLDCRIQSNELKAIPILFSLGFVDAELSHEDLYSISIYRRAVNIAPVPEGAGCLTLTQILGL